MSENAPTVEQVAEAIHRADHGASCWCDYISWITDFAAAVQALYAPVVAESERLRAQVKRVEALVGQCCQPPDPYCDACNFSEALRTALAGPGTTDDDVIVVDGGPNCLTYIKRSEP